MRTFKDVTGKAEWRAAITARAYGASAQGYWRRGGDWVGMYLLTLMRSLDHSRRARRVRSWSGRRYSRRH